MLVLEAGISPEYFLDKMQMYELPALLNNLYKRNKDSWEQTRLIGYITAQVNSTKKLNITDIIKFGWEAEVKETGISNAEIERLRNKANKTINTL